MDYLYSLYDALVSINVPGDKARAVVDAMERDMGTTLATKQDLDALKLATKQDLEILGRGVENRLALLEQKLDAASAQQNLKLDAAFARLVENIDKLRSDTARDLAALDLRMTVKLGSLIFVGVGATIAALRLWL